MYDPATIARVRRLSAKGLSDYEVARRAGVPRSTVRNWRVGRTPTQTRPPLVDWRPQDRQAYAYLLGQYLGDGHVEVRGGSAELTISTDGTYPGLIQEVAATAARVFPSAAIRVRPVPGSGCVNVKVAGRETLAAFPQHGPGKKHQRPIVLQPWQREITSSIPAAFVRGLVHSDGCRCVNRFDVELGPRTYEYVRYFFSNLSSDIRGIFRDHCALLGIDTSVSGRNVSVSRRAGVEILERYVGPKT